MSSFPELQHQASGTTPASTTVESSSYSSPSHEATTPSPEYDGVEETMVNRMTVQCHDEDNWLGFVRNSR